MVIGTLICWLRGHKRGKRITYRDGMPSTDKHYFECPRCGAQWKRKVKVKQP